jgi:hypothetical protein
MLTTRKHLASFFILIVFFTLAVSSSRVNKLHYGAFVYTNNVEGDEYGKTYLVDNLGTKIYGKEINWKSGLLTKNQIRIDNDKYKIAEIRGYMDHGVYYGRLKNEYIKRIVHGKINVYVAFTLVTSTDYDPHSHFSHTHSYTRTDHYAQRGENGPMIAFGGQKSIIELVKDCPLSVQMIDKSNGQIRRAVRKNRNYLNNVFDVYNNGCKPLDDGIK